TTRQMIMGTDERSLMCFMERYIDVVGSFHADLSMYEREERVVLAFSIMQWAEVLLCDITTITIILACSVLRKHMLPGAEAPPSLCCSARTCCDCARLPWRKQDVPCCCASTHRTARSVSAVLARLMLLPCPRWGPPT